MNHQTLLSCYFGGLAVLGLIDMCRSDERKRAKWRERAADPDGPSNDRIASASVVLAMLVMLGWVRGWL